MAGDTAAPSVASRGAVAKADPGSVSPPCRPRSQMAAQTSPRSDVPVCGVKEEEKRGLSETRDWRGNVGRAPGPVGHHPTTWRTGKDGRHTWGGSQEVLPEEAAWARTAGADLLCRSCLGCGWECNHPLGPGARQGEGRAQWTQLGFRQETGSECRRV
ncbi:unnamed protein product [Rangifer tarandus platyrhynchus]|uniref:Uncharacterized protein n=2 Tax=Rangifer tarandus platyrhynchus TaxID=3082113 RepID=A0ABN8ZYH2_RANTA|nr:unnamed protein product [Rangifer tarandus platyrhynchus]